MSTDEKREVRRQQGRRLKQARLQLGLMTATSTAQFLKVSEDTYAAHENGNRGIGRAAKDYADKLGVPEEWLLRDKNPPHWAIPEIDLSPEERHGASDHFLREWRLYRRLSEEDLSDSLGIPIDLLRSWERGDIELSGKVLRRIAEVLDTTGGSILDVDPEAVAPGILQLWRDATNAQLETRRRLAGAQATGTDG